MKFYNQLFDSDWRERGDVQARARQSRHYESMPEQVMANRQEILFLQNELDRVSGDLAQAMILNRALVKLLVSEKVCSPEALTELLAETVQRHEVNKDPEMSPSRFCEDCGRPLPQPGQTCPYCTEIELAPNTEPAEDSEDKPVKSKKKTKSKKKKKKPD